MWSSRTRERADRALRGDVHVSLGVQRRRGHEEERLFRDPLALVCVDAVVDPAHASRVPAILPVRDLVSIAAIAPPRRAGGRGHRGAATAALADPAPEPGETAPAATTPGPARALATPRPRPPRPGIRWRRSRSLGTWAGGRLVRGVRLPAESRDFFTWDPVLNRRPDRQWRRFGTDRLVRLLHPRDPRGPPRASGRAPGSRSAT